MRFERIVLVEDHRFFGDRRSEKYLAFGSHASYTLAQFHQRILADKGAPFLVQIDLLFAEGDPPRQPKQSLF
jgi:hypothetical protein